MSNKRLRAGLPAPEAKVYNANGQPVQISTLWADGPILLTFLRHFGWIFCREWLAQLEQAHEKITSVGLRLQAIGLGEPKHARYFCGKLAPHVTCHVDQDKKAYAIYGLRQAGLTEMMNPAMYMASARAIAGGHIQGEATGDTWMLPGTFIVDGDGIVQYAYYSQHAGDHPDINKMLRAWTLRNEEEE